MVIHQRLQAGLPFERIPGPFEIIRCDGERPNWAVHSLDIGLMAVARELQSEFDLAEEAPRARLGVKRS